MADTTEAMQIMRDQANYYGITVDALWSPEDLAQKIMDAQLAAETKANAEFAKAKKVKIRMVRDCWALTTRIPAGKTADIPLDLARRWIESGAAKLELPDTEI